MQGMSPPGMDYISRLYKYGQQNSLNLKLVEEFSYHVQIGEREFANVIVKRKKEAKHEAAKLAYDELTREGSRQSARRTKWGMPSLPSGSEDYISWLKEYGRNKNRVVRFVERFAAQFITSNQEFGYAVAEKKKEAKHEAAKMAYEELIKDGHAQDGTVSGSINGETRAPVVPDLKDSEQEAESLNSGDSDDSIVFKDSSPRPEASAAISPSLDGTVSGSINGETRAPVVPDLKDFDQISPLGKGGFGYVWKARKILEDKFYAVKRVKYTDKASREVAALAKLDHKNIVQYVTYWEFESSTSDSSSGPSPPQRYLFIQMKLYEKGTLETWMKENKGNKIKAKWMFAQIVDGVEKIHSNNLIHRDLKPNNIFIGDDDTVKIGDFGLACTTSSDDDNTLIERTKYAGTNSYMSPEQKNLRKYGNEVDIFSLGLIFFELLWPMSTDLEKSKIWPDVREGIFPEPFCKEHDQECSLIRAMLSEDPKKRPTAKHLSKRMDKMINNNSCKPKTV
ncbi:interferon-induced, double-stranded RNA-activated protein kinase-like isoform X3 [Polypterus senegalus]|uniref:interferon-induced, double-stranded RNA-activated protein kinase-like isoform X3 n=1 Tax=Polypterus senegalus TaxID=55291 RepID=UPI0019655F07|nr:interferon-induced, double-stranded RNA-activated protein kinase-like isoform X3 [Polypterus senegalus]